jgi:hypothetical protein
LLELSQVGDEPDVASPVGLAHPVLEGVAGRKMGGDIAHHRQPRPVLDELLNDRARYPGPQLEELGREPIDRYGDPFSAMGQRNQVDRIPIVSGLPSAAQTSTGTPSRWCTSSGMALQIRAVSHGHAP